MEPKGLLEQADALAELWRAVAQADAIRDAAYRAADVSHRGDTHAALTEYEKRRATILGDTT